jgi:hypothetical protein
VSRKVQNRSDATSCFVSSLLSQIKPARKEELSCALKQICEPFSTLSILTTEWSVNINGQ